MYNLSSDWILRRCWIYFLVHWQNFFHVKLMTMFVAVYFAFSYYFAGGTATYKTYLNVSYFHDLAREISEAELLISKTKFPDIPIWLGETSDAYNSGTKNVSDRFVSGFLWVAVTIFQFFMGNVRANAISLLEMFSYTYFNWHFLKKLLLLYYCHWCEVWNVLSFHWICLSEVFCWLSKLLWIYCQVCIFYFCRNLEAHWFCLMIIWW